MRRSNPMSQAQEMESRLRVQHDLDRWHWWLRTIREKAARVPLNHGTQIWDEDVIPLRQPVDECPE